MCAHTCITIIIVHVYDSLTVMGQAGQLVAGRADAEAAVLAGPVEVEQRGVTCVTQLPHSLHSTLPHGENFWQKNSDHGQHLHHTHAQHTHVHHTHTHVHHTHTHTCTTHTHTHTHAPHTFTTHTHTCTTHTHTHTCTTHTHTHTHTCTTHTHTCTTHMHHTHTHVHHKNVPHTHTHVHHTRAPHTCTTHTWECTQKQVMRCTNLYTNYEKLIH